MKNRKLLLKVLISILLCCTIWFIGKHWAYYPSRPVVIQASNKFITKFNQFHWKPASAKKIIFWTKEFRTWGWAARAQHVLPRCNRHCIVTNDRSELNSSDAVLFHSEDIWTNRRSLAATVYNTLNELPPYRNPSQVWVYWNLEPVSHTSGKIPSDMFNWTTVYRRDSTIFNPYEDRYVRKTEKELNQSGPVSKYSSDYLKDKTKMAVIVESNCADQSRRYRMVAEIGKYVDVDQFGECTNNVICPKNYGRDECDKHISHYKFYLAFENSICEDYITEKFWRSLTKRRQIPVIATSNATTELLPPHSYLNVFDFHSIKELTDKMKEIGNNSTLYNSFFDWIPYYKMDDENTFCKLCEALHENRTPQVYHDLEGWTKHDSCAKLSVSKHYVSLSVPITGCFG